MSFRRLMSPVRVIGGYHTEIALMARAARDRGYPVQLVSSGVLATEEFGLIAGPAAEGTLYTDIPNPRSRAEAAPVVERLPSVRLRTGGLSPCTLMVPFRCGRRRPSKRARWSSRR